MECPSCHANNVEGASLTSARAAEALADVREVPQLEQNEAPSALLA